MESQKLTTPAQPATVIPLRQIVRRPVLRLEESGRLAEVVDDWLFQQLSTEGRIRLLREHELLAA